MRLLIQRERVDPVVSSVDNPALRYTLADVSEEDLNSECQLLTGADLLEKIVLAMGFHKQSTLWTRLRGYDEQARIAVNVRALAKKIDVAVPKKSNVISVTYRSADPKQATRVLQTLSALYLEKHAQVHRPPGQYEFFSQETKRYQKELAEAERQLVAFPQQSGVVSGPMERDLMVQRIADLKVTLQTTTAAIRETQERIDVLIAQMANTPDRVTTALKKEDNPELMQKLQGTLLDLQLQYTELLEKYQPTHRLVREVKNKIDVTQAAIDAALKAPLTANTTDRDVTYEWMREELAKARTDLKSLTARAETTRQSIADFESQARSLNERSIEQQGLLRNAKLLEDNYQLYLRKSEEARITDALDRSKILNVSLAEEPTAPVLPVESLMLILLKALFAAIVTSIAAVLVVELMDSTFRGPGDVQRCLGVPVLAFLPEHIDASL
jgi:uncharacterized protein involved in exopolysaccharide biosynthesis